MDKVKYRKKSNKIKGKSVLERLLKESEEKYRLITENALVGIYQLDAAGRFIFVNKALARLVGYQPKELIGKHFSFVLPPARTLKGQEIFKELTANGQYKKNVLPSQESKNHICAIKKGTIFMCNTVLTYHLKPKETAIYQKLPSLAQLPISARKKPKKN